MCEERKRGYKVPGDDRVTNECVVYFSECDKCWIAHGLQTDQIGTGNDVITALVELMVAIESLIKLTRLQKDIRLYRDAPQKILQRAKKAEQLPQELYEKAYKRFLALSTTRVVSKRAEEVEGIVPKFDKHYDYKVALAL